MLLAVEFGQNVPKAIQNRKAHLKTLDFLFVANYFATNKFLDFDSRQKLVQ